MRSVPKWIDKIQDSDKVEQSIYDLCFNPDGTQLIVAGGNHVLVYDAANGTLIQLLKGHKDKVHTVSYAKNGEKFASGSSDKTVIIWTNKLEGLLKYSHNDSVQCVAFNPLSHQLASCALTDFAFWSTEQKAVQKHKTNIRINSCSWTNDGQYLALGLNNGAVSIRNKLGEEKCKIERPNSSPIWALAWSPYKDEQNDLLCVTDWNKILAFYTLGGKLVGKERNIGYNALKIKYFPQGDYILIAGLNKCCKLYTKEGIMIGTIGEVQKSWIWCCEIDPGGNYVALGCEDGTIAYYHLMFNTIHGLYRERYAYRENMTDIIIQHLLTEQKVRIKCRDLIKKIAIYTDRLAVQLSERIIIYELYSKDTNDMRYRAKEKISKKIDCNLLVICTNCLIICQDTILLSMNFTGDKDKEWTFLSPIRYIKNIGGPIGKEGLLIGLKNGQVWEVHVDNIHPLLKVTINDAVRCLDISQRKERLAVLDDTGLCQVFQIKTGELYYQETNANSVAFNSLFEEMIAFSGNNLLSIKVMDFPAHVQTLTGFVVGLIGSKIFVLNGSVITSVELPLSAPMYQFIERKMFSNAYRTACLGVPKEDWLELAHAALEQMDFETARMAFIKLQDFNYLELIEEIQDQQQQGDYNRDVIMGDVLAMKGKLKEAARYYQKSGHESKALTMYTDLRMFDEAQEYIGAKDNDELIRQKANWARNINEYKAAADMYISIGDIKTAIEIYAEQQWTEQLIELSRRLDKSEIASLNAIAEHLKDAGQAAMAIEIYRRLGDSVAVLQLHVAANEWEQAFELIQSQPEHSALVYEPYAQWLAENDKFIQAQRAFHKAGKSDQAFHVFRELTKNAISECRFDDAGYYHYIIARQHLDLAGEDGNKVEWHLRKFQENERLAEIYYAYNTVHNYIEDPFTSHVPEALFNISRYLMIETSKDKPAGVSHFAIYFTLAKQAKKLGANKLAKQAFDKITSLRIPSKFQEQVEIATITSKARAYNDAEELLPMCYRCSTYNPLSSSSNSCVKCQEKFSFSFYSFEVLPLIEFKIPDGITDQEAIRLIETPYENKSKDSERFKEIIDENQQTLELKEINDDDKSVNNPFVFSFQQYDETKNYHPIVLNEQNLLELEVETVLICKWKSPLKYRYFKNLMPELHVTICETCFKTFHIEDFEFQVLKNGYCPFCRVSPDASLEADVSDDLLV